MSARAWDDLVIPSRLRRALRDLNPSVPVWYLEQAMAEILAPSSQDALTENHRIHHFPHGGLPGPDVHRRRRARANPPIRLVGVDPDRNDWLAANQVTVVGGDVERRFDVVLYLNGMPVVVIEPSVPARRTPTSPARTHRSRPTCAKASCLVFRFAVTGGDQRRHHREGLREPRSPAEPLGTVERRRRRAAVGAASSALRTADLASPSTDAAQRYLRSTRTRFLQLALNGYFAFDDGELDGLTKETDREALPVFRGDQGGRPTGDHRGCRHQRQGRRRLAHNQGSGQVHGDGAVRTNQMLRHPNLKNPTVIVVTDRTELDGDQPFQGFARSLLLPEKPQQVGPDARTCAPSCAAACPAASTSRRCRSSLAPQTSARRGPLTPAHPTGPQHDRRHRAGDARRTAARMTTSTGYSVQQRQATRCRDATLTAFTGTPMSFAELATPARPSVTTSTSTTSPPAAEDGATVPVHFESRLR
ncbi:MAG: type I restriction endonuclease [Cellulomonas sp.]|uniref:type I restriction endonuclease n=1 Tax=Cellulomonas sp. TaxID=40001 RepID=UPI00258F0C76|nr:type I restriction endonuclease [Cellulomonas sp.]MCR6704614.1 type I restriction endonuclease [Cellulomonas sp.]